jgi:selenoprotein W-related protein
LTEIAIEYCVPCGYLPRAEEIQHALLSRLERRVERLVLVPGRGGVLRVEVDGEPVFDKEREGYDLEAIAAAVEERLASRAPGR